VLSVSAGHDTGYLTGEVATGREAYYTGAVAAGEPPGLWYGAGAAALGLTGEVDADLMEALYSHLLDPLDPNSRDRATWDQAARIATLRAYRSPAEVYATLLAANPDAGPERRAELRAQADTAARQNVAFLDLTFSAPKSVSVAAVAFDRAAAQARARGDEVAAAVWEARRDGIEAAVLAGSRAMLDYMADRAGYSRVGHHGSGQGRWIDAHAWTVAQFLQHDSRDHDPQLHVHNAVLNRVRCADGKWRTLDSRAVHRERAAAGAVGERVMEAELAARGYRLVDRADGHGREIAGVQVEVMDQFSSRARAIGPATEDLVAAWTARHGRPPTALERTRLAQHATLDTRRGKTHTGETVAQRLDRWDAETRGRVDGGLDRVAADVVAAGQSDTAADTFDPEDLLEQALAALAAGKATWTRSDILRAVSDAAPANPGLAPEQIRSWLEQLADAVQARAETITPAAGPVDLPAAYRLADGSSALTAPGSALFATTGQVATERALRAAVVERGAATLPADAARAALARYAGAGHPLTADQAAALTGVLTSGARVEVLAAPAGTGKSFTVGAITDAWAQPDQAAGRRVFGLATSQVATEVLAEEGVTARNIAAWRATQTRLDTGHALDGDAAFRLRAGDLVVVDEAGIAATGDLADIHHRCRAADAKLLLVGDPRQLSAVGPGGALADLAERGVRYDLTEVRRFDQPWERAASLRLRDGDPAVVGDYDRHGRIRDGGTAEQTETAAARAWLADTVAGRNALLIVGSNEAAARVCAQLRAELVRLGKVTETGVPLGLQDTVAGVGDLVQARRNAWHLGRFDGNTTVPFNRDTYRVLAVRPDDGLTVAKVTGRDARGAETHGPVLQLPGHYVARHVALGYASTVHAAIGRTVECGHAVITPTTGPGAAYTALTRGTAENTAWVQTRHVPAGAETGQTHDYEPRAATAVLADVIGAEAGHDRSALAEREHAEDEARSVKTSLGRLAEGLRDATAGRTDQILDRLTAAGILPAQHRIALAADPARGSLAQLLRVAELAGHDPDQVLADAIAGRSLDGSRSTAQVLHARIRTALAGDLAPQLGSYTDLIPDGLPADWLPYLTARAQAADQRRRDLGVHAAEQPEPWAVQALGPVPDNPIERADWELRAGWAAAYRELIDHTDDADPLGAAPPATQVEHLAAFRTAHAALDLPDAGAAEAEMSDGQLRVRIRAWERELNWAPAWVGDELAATAERAAERRRDAALFTAHADAATDPAARAGHQAAAERAAVEAAHLDQLRADLEEAHTGRGAWYAHTTATRHAAERARIELATRGSDLGDPSQHTTAAQYLDTGTADSGTDPAGRTDVRAGDQTARAEATGRPEARSEDRAVGERAVGDPAELDTGDGDASAAAAVADPPFPRDIRQTSVRDPAEDRDPGQRRRVPGRDETAGAVTRARDALREIADRQSADTAEEADDAAGDDEPELDRQPPAAVPDDGLADELSRAR
jgi:conjugative relaxase-like TrwC/TraI family protein